MTTHSTTIEALGFKIEGDLILVNVLSASLIAVIAYFPNSPVRIMLGLPFLLFFSGYSLICALFPQKEDLDLVERLALSIGLSIAVASLMGLGLNYTVFAIKLYSVTFSIFSFILLMSVVTVYRRRILFSGDVFAPFSQMCISGWFERIKNESIKFSNADRSIKVIVIVAFTFIILALTIIAKTPPARGYEISIYGVYPWYFWVFIILSIFMGQITLIRSARSSDKTNRIWLLGFLAIITTNIILLFMPFIRGYAIYGRGDMLTHIGYIKDIFRTGSFGTANFYPSDHILTASLSYITDINVGHAVNIIPPFFFIFYIISIYFLAKQLCKRKGEVLFVLAFTSILLFCNGNLIFAPSVLSFFLLPFVLYLYFKSRDSRNPIAFGIMLIFLLFLIVFSHPMTTLFLIVLFLILELCVFIYKNIDKNQRSELLKLQKVGTLNVILIAFTTFAIWYFSFSAITNSLKRVANWLRYEIGKSPVETYSELIARTQPTFFDLIEVILNIYGQLIILGVLSFIFLIYIFNIWRRHTDEQKLKFYHIFFSVGTSTFIALSIIFFFNDFIIDFGRVSKYFLFFSSVFIALSFYLLFEKSEFSFDKRRFKSISLCVILILLLYFSTFNLYMSPRTKLSNQQVSVAQIDSMTWCFHHRNETTFILELGLSQKRFHDAIFGVAISGKNLRYGAATLPVDHFGYINKTLLGDCYEDRRYLLISTLGRIMYPELHPKYEEQWRFTPEDFLMLERDSTVLRIYDNEDVNIYFVDGGCQQ